MPAPSLHSAGSLSSRCAAFRRFGADKGPWFVCIIRSQQVVGFADLGMEAIYEFDVKDMPVTVAVSSAGISMHETGPKEWQAKIGGIPVKIA